MSHRSTQEQQNTRVVKHYVISKHMRTMNHKSNETPCHGKAHTNIKAQEHQNIGATR